jgi:hypothetical protein
MLHAGVPARSTHRLKEGVMKKRAIIVLALVVIVVVLVFVVPRLIVPAGTAEMLRGVDDANDRQVLLNSRLGLQNDVRDTMLQLLGGVAVLIGAYLTYRQLRQGSEGRRRPPWGAARPSGAWLLGADVTGAQWGEARYQDAYADPGPIMSWLGQTLGKPPWVWHQVTGALDAPTPEGVTALARQLSVPVATAEQVEALRAGARQIRHHLGKRLHPDYQQQVTDANIATALVVTGLSSDRPPR